MKPSHSTTSKVTAGSLLIALGIIYGDIGTSPLYVMKAIIDSKEISEMLVFGGVSCVFWTLVFQTTFKYITLTLTADNHGEGGIFSLYALVRRYGKGLVFSAMIGAATLLADGMITPPISVASAVEGLEKVAPHLPTVPIVIVIISFIFFFQRFGTQTVGRAFGPVMAVWFAMLLVLGAVQIYHYPDIVRALNPYYAIQLLTRYPHGFWLLGAVFLCTTGAEALYSDLGHCGKWNIRYTWIFVKTSLVVNYLGQAGWLLHHGDNYLSGRNPFYEIMPQWFLIPGIIIATAAAIIASQALISGSYTLISEAMSLNFWPRVGVRQPTEFKGQIYIPSVNIMLWAGCIAVMLYFQNSEHMEAAYGLAITMTMMTTTVLLSYYLYRVRKWALGLVAFLGLLFIFIELSFFIANLKKFPEGGFITLIIGGGLFTIMYSWYFARKINNKFVRFVDLYTYLPVLKELSEDDAIPKFSTHLIYLTKADHRSHIEEKVIKSIFSKKPKRADVYWFLHLNRTDSPYTLNYEVAELLDDKVIRIDINLGFRVQPRTELFFKKIVQDLVKNKELSLHIRPDGSTKYNPEPDFKFVVIEKFLSLENEFSLREGLLLNSYFFLKKLSQSDEKAFGLDKSDIVVEDVPMLVQPVQKMDFKRIP
ncbi:MAG TPA: KUP/HAK/KT family potassium transporter [Saprospiraceae bacterium]|mgnify:FL=1|nr:KUP/HAK/KT family potassium transporter [Saprospiraceae bacterium]HPI05312.1 KUP/HAK/KT family potassium transporter [Saprospiraceae bacterium]